MSDGPIYFLASSITADPAVLGPYLDKVVPMVGKAGGVLLSAAQDGDRSHYEGKWTENAAFTLIRFENTAALNSWWNSDEYAAVKHLRTDVAKPNVILSVRGLPLPDTPPAPAAAPVYFLASSVMKKGPDSLGPYLEKVVPMVAKAGGEVLVAAQHDDLDVYEGDWAKKAAFTLLRFPSKAALDSWWLSDEYAKVKHLRTDVAPPNAIFSVPGLPIAAPSASRVAAASTGCLAKCCILM